MTDSTKKWLRIICIFAFLIALPIFMLQFMKGHPERMETFHSVVGLNTYVVGAFALVYSVWYLSTQQLRLLSVASIACTLLAIAIMVWRTLHPVVPDHSLWIAIALIWLTLIINRIDRKRLKEATPA